MLYPVDLTREELEHNIMVLHKERHHLEGKVSELKTKFAVEVKAKNEAYAFILESGLFEQFKEYTRLKVCGDNPHQACREWLDYEAKRRRKQNQ